MTLRSTTSTCLEEGCAPCKTGSLNTGEALLEVPDFRFVLAERVLETDCRLAVAAAHPAELGTPLSDGPARLLLRGRWAMTQQLI